MAEAGFRALRMTLEIRGILGYIRNRMTNRITICDELVIPTGVAAEAKGSHRIHLIIARLGVRFHWQQSRRHQRMDWSERHLREVCASRRLGTNHGVSSPGSKRLVRYIAPASLRIKQLSNTGLLSIYNLSNPCEPFLRNRCRIVDILR